MRHPIVLGVTPAVLACLWSVSPAAAAQGVRKDQAQDARSEQVIEKVVSTDDGSGAKTQRYRKVIRDGKVVEESGEAGIGGGGDPADALRRLRRIAEDGGKGGAHQTSEHRSHSRRVVVVNGETVVDEETVDGQPVKPGAIHRGRVLVPGGDREGLDELHDLHEHLRKMLDDKVGDLDQLHDHLQRLRRVSGSDSDSDSDSASEHQSSTHRVVIVNGEKVVDEKTRNGKPVDPVDADELSRHLRREMDRLLDEDLKGLPRRVHEELQRTLRRDLDRVNEDAGHAPVRIEIEKKVDPAQARKAPKPRGIKV